MTPTQKKAMEMALEALEQLQGGCTDSEDGTVEAITVWCPEVTQALRAALAERQPLFKPLIDQLPGLAEELAEQVHEIVFCEAPKCMGTAKTCTGPCSRVGR